MVNSVDYGVNGVYMRNAAAKPTVAAQTERRILSAARKCLLDHGFEGLSMRAVATDAGITVGAIYRHFPSRSALIKHITTEAYNRYVEALWKNVAAIPVGSFLRLVHLGEAYITFAIEHPEDFKVLFSPHSGRPRKVAEIQGQRNYEIVKQCVVDCIKSGAIRKGDPELITAYLWARIHGVAMLLLAADFSGRLPAAAGKYGAIKLFRATRVFLLEGIQPPKRKRGPLA